jgi:hypothetical protein
MVTSEAAMVAMPSAYIILATLAVVMLALAALLVWRARAVAVSESSFANGGIGSVTPLESV